MISLLSQDQGGRRETYEETIVIIQMEDDDE
jgi:hypothetical protein